MSLLRKVPRLPFYSTLLLALLCAPAAAAERLMLWRVQNASGTVYLLGSIHFGSADMYPLDRKIMQAFSDADLLAVEIDVLAIDPLQTAQLMLQKGLYGDGDSLPANLNPATWQQLSDTATAFGLPLAAVERQKPWLAVLTLSALAAKQAGYREDLGIDYFFLQQAREGGKPVVELESFAQQVELFDGLSADQQDSLLAQTLNDLADAEQFFQRMFATWRSGDAQQLDQLVNQSLAAQPQLRPVYEKLLVERNQDMAAGIERLLAEGKTPFVVVGAGHVVGEQGLAQYFLDKTYTVEQLKPSL